MAQGDWWDPRPYLNKKADEQARKLNFVWRQIIDPCDAPLTVWAWAFWPAFKKLVLAWYAIDLSQIMIAYLRPKFRAVRTRSYRHWGGGTRGKRPGSKGGRLNPVSFDPNEFIGDDLLGFNHYGGRGPLPGELWFWSVEGITERAAFYWMVLDLGSDFLYDWASAVARTKYCHARDDAVLYASNPGYPLLGIFGWDAVGSLQAKKMRHIAFWNGYAALPDFGPAQVLIGASMYQLGTPAPGAWAKIRMTCLTGPRIGLQVEQHYDFSGDEHKDVAVTAPTGSGELWIGEIKVNGWFQVEEPYYSLHAVAPNPQ